MFDRDVRLGYRNALRMSWKKTCLVHAWFNYIIRLLSGLCTIRSQKNWANARKAAHCNMALWDVLEFQQPVIFPHIKKSLNNNYTTSSPICRSISWNSVSHLLLGGWYELPVKNCQEEAAAQQRVAFSSHSLCTESRFGCRNEKLYLK